MATPDWTHPRYHVCIDCGKTLEGDFQGFDKDTDEPVYLFIHDDVPHNTYDPAFDLLAHCPPRAIQ